eukprot:130809_1
MSNPSLEQIVTPHSEAEPLQLQIIEPIEEVPISKVTTSPTESPTKSPTTTTRSVQYVDLDAYTQYHKSPNIIPSSWEDLSHQQFCPIPQTATNLKQFLQFIYETQFGRDCNDPNQRFVIYDVKIEAGSGLGASLLGNLKRYFAVSLMLNRTFLLTGAYDWSFDRPYCQGKDGMECYFLPVSNCNPIDILQNPSLDRQNPFVYYKGPRPKDCIFGNNIVQNANLTHCPHKVIHVDKGDPSYVLLNGEIRSWIQAKFGIGMMAYEAMIPAFFLRPQPV